MLQTTSIKVDVNDYRQTLEDFCADVEKFGIVSEKREYLRACHLLGRMPMTDEELIVQSNHRRNHDRP